MTNETSPVISDDEIARRRAILAQAEHSGDGDGDTSLRTDEDELGARPRARFGLN